MKLRSAAFTDIGKVRPENEDRLLCDDGLRLYGVADGIGGLPGGAEAAGLTVQFVQNAIRAGASQLDAVAQAASEAVSELGERLNPHMGIGSTLTFGVFKDGALQLAHVGDSRAYLLRAGRLRLLTEDHNAGNEARRQLAQGKSVHAPEHPQFLTRCIGQPGLPEVDLSRHDLRPGDRCLFCTDGVTHLVPDDELAALLAADLPPSAILKTIADLVLERGALDNLTGVLVLVDEA